MTRAQLASLAESGPGELAVPGLHDSLDALRIAITLFDRREKLTYANRHFNYLFRSMPDRERLVGKSYEELIRLEITGGELAPVTGMRDYIATRCAQLTEGDFTPRDIQLADGRIIELKARRSASGDSIVLWSDVTQARQFLGRLESTIELTADAFAFFNRNGKLAMCSRGFAQLHGYDEPAGLTGLRGEDIARKAAEQGLFVLDAPLADWLARRAEMQKASAGAMTILSSNGKAYLMRDRATKNGRICVFTDVTDRNRAETALAEQIEALQRTKEALDASEDYLRQQETYLADLMDRLSHAQADADETKRRLLRTMSHELKTPLNAIIGFSDLMGNMAGALNPDQIREYSGLIHQGGLNLLSLINQILDLTKIAAGKYELHRGDIRVQSALERAVDARADAAHEKRIAIEIEECGDVFAVADSDALDSMLNHLVGNAVRYTQSGGQVRLSAREADGKVLFSVSDNGPGVAPEDLKRILLPFEQAGCKYADHSAGAGLGLTLVLAFAELHGGTLALESAPEGGFTATLILPRAQRT